MKPCVTPRTVASPGSKEGQERGKIAVPPRGMYTPVDGRHYLRVRVRVSARYTNTTGVRVVTGSLSSLDDRNNRHCIERGAWLTCDPGGRGGMFFFLRIGLIGYVGYFPYIFQSDIFICSNGQSPNNT